MTYQPLQSEDATLKVAPQEAATVEGLMALIDKYWGLAYAEGKEGRDHDTEDGDAQETRHGINEAIRALLEPAPAEAVRDAVLEEAAVKCDWINANKYGSYPADCAVAIRALKTTNSDKERLA